MAKGNFIRRKLRTRFKIRSVTDRPRLSVFVSVSHIYVQLIDDQVGKTLISSSSLALKISHLNINAAREVGADIARKSREIGISEVVFDRGGRLYHGKIKALADSARESGLKF